MLRSALSALLIVLSLSAVTAASAQERTRPPVGLGFDLVVSSSEGLGMGMRFRASAPINSDLSFAFGAGMAGFVLDGRQNASYLVDPQMSIIVTIPRSEYSGTYLMGGLGAYLPFSKEGLGETGPTLHAGFGWLRGLNDSTIFYEVNPALIIGETSVGVSLPVRVGVIF